MPVEIELKLRIHPDEVKGIYTHPILAQYAHEEPLQQRLVTTYFDTPCHLLYRKGYALRIRKVDGKLIQTLKDAGERDGNLHRRQEWEEEVAKLNPDLNLIPDIKLKNELLQLIGDKPLLPLFNTEFVRTSWQLELPDGNKVELALDQGDISTSALHDPISEVELELKKGDAAILQVIADSLQKTIPLAVEHRSKADRGYRLCEVR